MSRRPAYSADLDLRIGDAEREQVAARLHEHVGAGRLDLTEFERRVDTVYAARTRGELQAVLADLPAAGSGPAQAAPARRRGVSSAVFWGPWLATAVIVMVIWLATSIGSGHPQYFWPIWVIGPWAAVLLVGRVSGCPAARRR